MPATATATPYPKYAQGRHEKVTWFAQPIDVGKRLDVVASQLVALGISHSLEPRGVEALIMDVKATAGTRPVLLGRMLKFNPQIDIDFDMTVLKQLAKDYDLVLTQP